MHKKRILVCVSQSPASHKLIHIASQIAASEQAMFSAVCVIEPRHNTPEDTDLKRCMEHMDYARNLGADAELIFGHFIALRIAAYAKSRGASKIVLGRSILKKDIPVSRRYLAKELKTLLPDIEVTTVPNTSHSYDEKEKPEKIRVRIGDIWVSAAILTVTTLLCWWFEKLGLNDAALITLYILAVLLISFFTNGYLCGIVSSILSVNIFNFLFTVPYFSLKSYAPGYPVTLIVMFLTAFLTSYLTAQVRRQAQQHAQNAYRTEILLSANRILERATDENEIFRSAADQVGKLLMRSVLLYPVRDNKLDIPIPVPFGEDEGSLRSSASISSEQKVAEWVIGNNVQAGASTGIFDDSAFWYLAVRVNDDDAVCAVVAIRIGKNEPIDPFDKNLVLAMLGECAVAIDKERLDRAGEQYAFRIEQEQMRSNLLRSISHDLRTPLTTISGNAAMLMSGDVPTENERQQVYSDIYEDSIWLIDLVENLLSITKLDNGHLGITLQPQDISDMIDAAVSHVQPRSKDHHISVIPPAELTIVNVDCTLFIQLLDNLLENAFKYSGENGDIMIETKRTGDNVVILVADNGPGIPDAEKEKVFDMFYTTQNHAAADDRRGLGLGLALCRLIVQEHQGTINVYDNDPHGAVFKITLPAINEDI